MTQPSRSQQRIAEATLNDYASFADWQLTQQAKSSVLSSVITSLSAQASRVDPRRLAQTMLSPEQTEADDEDPHVARGLLRRPG